MSFLSPSITSKIPKARRWGQKHKAKNCGTFVWYFSIPQRGHNLHTYIYVCIKLFGVVQWPQTYLVLCFLSQLFGASNLFSWRVGSSNNEYILVEFEPHLNWHFTTVHTSQVMYILIYTWQLLFHFSLLVKSDKYTWCHVGNCFLVTPYYNFTTDGLTLYL